MTTAAEPGVGPAGARSPKRSRKASSIEPSDSKPISPNSGSGLAMVELPHGRPFCESG